MTNAARNDRFTIREGFRLGSEVFGAAFSLNVVFSLLHRVYDMGGWQLTALFALNFAIAVLVVLPWALRRGMRKQFSTLRAVTRIAGDDMANLTYGESLKLSVLAAFGTLGTVVLPMQWGLLLPETHWPWPIDFLAGVAILIGISTLTGLLFFWNLNRRFSATVRRSLQS